MAKTAIGNPDHGPWRVIGVVLAGATIYGLMQKDRWDAADLGKFAIAGITVAAFFLR